MCNPFHRCCGDYDVLAYSIDSGAIVKRQYHHHGGYNLNEGGIKPGMKITVSADSDMVVCASDTNLSWMRKSERGEATRLHVGTFSSQNLFTGNTLVNEALDNGELVRGRWRLAKKSHSGDWWVSCTTIRTASGPQQYYYRAWKLSNSGTLRGMPVQVPSLGFLISDHESDYYEDGSLHTGDNYWCVQPVLSSFYAPERFVDGTIPQSVIGGDQVFCAPMGLDPTTDPIAGQFGFDGIISNTEKFLPPVNDLDVSRARNYFKGGAQLYYDGFFAWCNRFASIGDGPVFGRKGTGSDPNQCITVSLGTTSARLPVDFPTSFNDASAKYYDTGTSSFVNVDTQIGTVDEDQHWHGIKWAQTTNDSQDLGDVYGGFQLKLGTCTYRELDFTSPHALGSIDWPELVRSQSSPFGTITYNGTTYDALPKDVFVADGFLYTLLPDEENPYYYRRLVKIDLSDFSVVWTKTPPEDWQCFHSLNLSADRIWVAVSASDGYVFEDPA
ncbi:MAG: hypothetical protein E6Q97_34145 [Desulfurellales bacterium]|nr:MAG: hypothetical protein E6Q97_34145 [Desulfurellales bacterium]